jgi:hypothetical protein
MKLSIIRKRFVNPEMSIHLKISVPKHYQIPSLIDLLKDRLDRYR